MSKAKPSHAPLTNNDIRRLMLRYFYDRNKNATSGMGKKGSAVRISDIKADLKAAHRLTQQEVQSNLTYLLSQGWVEEKAVEKRVVAKGGTVIPSITKYYQVTADGIDKIEGPGEFTMPRFHGIKIDASGQNIITLGDGNQIDAQFSEPGEALAELRNAITESEAPEAQKMSAGSTYGVYVQGGFLPDATVYPAWANVTGNNTIASNTYGVWVDAATADLAKFRVFWNDVRLNGQGAHVTGDPPGADFFHAECNWWNHDTGPLDNSTNLPDYNPLGQGQYVSDYFFYREEPPTPAPRKGWLSNSSSALGTICLGAP